MLSPQSGETLSRPSSFSGTPLALMSLVCLNFFLAFVANSNKIKLLPLFQICPVLCDLILLMALLLTRNSTVPLSVEYIVEVLSDTKLLIHSALDEAGSSPTLR